MILDLIEITFGPLKTKGSQMIPAKMCVNPPPSIILDFV